MDYNFNLCNLQRIHFPEGRLWQIPKMEAGISPVINAAITR
jgi:hypothetical protein